MNKKGLSAVITTLIIVLLVLVAVGVVWVVIANLIDSGAEEISLGKFTLNMEIKNVEVKGDGTVDVKVKRNAGKGELSGIKFLINDGVEVHEFTKETTVGELGQRTFNLNYDGLIKEVSIAPIFTLESGKESLGNEIDFEKLSNKEIIENLGGINWWRFENGGNDEIGDNDGDLNGGIDCHVEGVYGKACEFDGSTGYIDISDNPLWDFGTDDFSVSFFFIKDDASRAHALSFGGGSTNLDFNFDDSSYGVWVYWVSGGGNHVWTTSNYSDGEWHHLVYTREGNNFKLYLDNIEIDQTTDSSDITVTGANYIGAASPTSQNFEGKLDEVIIFNKGLSEDEVNALYNLDLS